MDATTRGQVNRSAAGIYDEFFVPALFRIWVGTVADAAAVAAGQKVLDVACGTGVLAREAAGRVAPGGSVVGVDINDGMLAVAARKAPDIDWRQAPAEALPFDNDNFDAVISQFGLMFFEDRATALREMWRVLRPGGRLAVAVWGRLEDAPGYVAMTGLLQRLFGDAVAAGLRAPYCLGDRAELGQLFADAGIPKAEVATHNGVAAFPSVKDWVHVDVKGWTLADMIDDEQYATLQREAPAHVAEFVQADGSVRFAHPAHIVTAQK